MQTGAFPQFDYCTITDIILTFRYTAWEACGLLHQQATVDLQAAVDKIALSQNDQGLARLFSVRHEFADRCHQLRRRPFAQTAAIRTVSCQAKFVICDLTIEFNFRDAKQFWGLEDFMNVNPATMNNAGNLSLSMVNRSKLLMCDF
ncbi:MAG: hypothetical protein CVU39_24990 [Chloroflexi bacterium HGW-Chloroflexi-10]|nr:MAG: hypothetical protein CVU39_24990 [Chloroflexi bacterium HGW-Chloroflexi-10]